LPLSGARCQVSWRGGAWPAIGPQAQAGPKESPPETSNRAEGGWGDPCAALSESEDRQVGALADSNGLRISAKVDLFKYTRFLYRGWRDRAGEPDREVSKMPAMSLTVRAIRLADAAQCGIVAYEAHQAVASAHNFPPEHPSVEFSIGLFKTKVGDS